MRRIGKAALGGAIGFLATLTHMDTSAGMTRSGQSAPRSKKATSSADPARMRLARTHPHATLWRYAFPLGDSLGPGAAGPGPDALRRHGPGGPARRGQGCAETGGLPRAFRARTISTSPSRPTRPAYPAQGPALQVPGRDDHRPAAPVLGPGARRDLLLGDAAVLRPAQAAVGPLRRGHPLLRSLGAVPAAVRAAAARAARGPGHPRGARRRRRARPKTAPRSFPSTSSGRNNDRRRERRRPRVSPTRRSSSGFCAPGTSRPAPRPSASGWSRSARPRRWSRWSSRRRPSCCSIR